MFISFGWWLDRIASIHPRNVASLQVDTTLLVLKFGGMRAETADWAGAAVGGGGVHHARAGLRM
jgi:hypothetical protein